MTYGGRKYILVESKYQFQHTSTDFIKEVRNSRILEVIMPLIGVL